MQVKKKPRNAAAKKIQKASPKEKCTKKEQTEQPLLKRMIFGEERPDLTELEAGSTTILDILAPTTVDTKSKDYIVVDGVYHTYLYIRFPTGEVRATTAALANLSKEKLIRLVNRHIRGDWGDTCMADQKANEQAIRDGDRILSWYQISGKIRVLIITEADRSATTIMLADEY